MKKYLLGLLTGVCLMLVIEGSLLTAYAERGYWAVGGEWLLILVGIPGIVYGAVKFDRHIKNERQRRVREINQKRLEKWFQNKATEYTPYKRKEKKYARNKC